MVLRVEALDTRGQKIGMGARRGHLLKHWHGHNAHVHQPQDPSIDFVSKARALNSEIGGFIKAALR